MPKPNSRKEHIDKRCRACGEPLRQGENEQLRDWRARKSCNRTCHVANKNSRPVWERFFENAVKVESGCIEWIGDIDDEGYGRIWTNGDVLAHRVAYIMQNGAIPEGMCICHRCDNRRCVNPMHLFVGTHQDNADDCVRKGRRPSQAGQNNSNWRHGRFVRPLETANG